MNTSAKTRLASFLALSLLLHLFLLYVLARFPSVAPHAPEEPPTRVHLIEMEEPAREESALVAEKPRLFDMMEVEEAWSDVPGSLSQSPGAPPADPVTSLPEPPPAPARQPEPEPKVAKKEPPPAPPPPRKPPPPRTEIRQEPLKESPAKKPLERPAPEEPEREAVLEKPPPDRPRELPSVRELIPSIHDILAMRSPRGSLYRHDTVVQDGIGERAARAAFDEYLAEFKSRVRLNWKVLDDPYMHESTTVLLIVINGDGTLGSVRRLRSSGMPGQDTQTVYAVRNALPMRPPPDILLDENGQLSINFSFHFLVRSTFGADAAGRADLGRRRPWRPDPNCTPPCIRW